MAKDLTDYKIGRIRSILWLADCASQSIKKQPDSLDDYIKTFYGYLGELELILDSLRKD